MGTAMFRDASLNKVFPLWPAYIVKAVRKRTMEEIERGDFVLTRMRQFFHRFVMAL